MKELSIEGKATRYDKVVNKLRRFMEQGIDPLITRADVQDFFPELAESEDEKIRKELLDYFYNLEGQTMPSDKYNKFVGWLKKQGKQKFVSNLLNLWHNKNEKYDGKDAIILYHSTYDDAWHLATSYTVNWNSVDKWILLSDILTIEQKPVEKHSCECIHVGCHVNSCNRWCLSYQKEVPYELCNELCKRYSMKQRPEWSEEDEMIFNNIEYLIRQSINKSAVPKYIGLLKSLRFQKQCDDNVPSREYILNVWELGNHWKDITNGVCNTEHGTQLEYIQKHWKEGEYYEKLVPQKHWKPSKEQMKALKNAFNNGSISFSDMEILATLFECLKAL